jgi:tRNA-dihydrouridine synthase B
MAEGAEKAIRFKPDFIDINMGCPVKKVIKRGAGSALMKKPDLAAKIVSSVKAVCQNRLPVTVKIRSGWDINSINAVEFAKMMEQAGADLIIVHPRTRSQMFAGESDWSIIKAVKEQINIPVIGNGDISSIEAAAKMYDQTSCDGLMIGRGVIGKPWIFRQIKLYLQDAEIWKPGSEEIMETIKRHFDLVSADRGEKIAMKEMRTHLAAYTRGYKYSASLRQKINHLNDIPLMIKEIENLIRQSELISDK